MKRLWLISAIVVTVVLVLMWATLRKEAEFAPASLSFQCMTNDGSVPVAAFILTNRTEEPIEYVYDVLTVHGSELLVDFSNRVCADLDEGGAVAIYVELPKSQPCMLNVEVSPQNKRWNRYAGALKQYLWNKGMPSIAEYIPLESKGSQTLTSETFNQ